MQRYAGRRALFAFGANLDLLERFSRNAGMLSKLDRPTVATIIEDIKALKRREKKPPLVPFVDGWSPYAACKFLEDHHLLTNDYHTFTGEYKADEWWAESPMRKIGNGLFQHSLIYHVSGTEHAATHLKLKLDARLQDQPEEGEAIFRETAVTLTHAALGKEAAERLHKEWESLDSSSIAFDGVTVLHSYIEWGNSKFGGYYRSYELRHNAYKEPSYD